MKTKIQDVWPRRSFFLRVLTNVSKKCYLLKKAANERLNFWGRESGWVMEIYHFFITISHPSTVEPRFNEVAGDRPNLFVEGTVSQTAHVRVISQKWSDVFKFVICEAKAWRQQAEYNLHSHGGRKNNSGRKKFFSFRQRQETGTGEVEKKNSARRKYLQVVVTDQT